MIKGISGGRGIIVSGGTTSMPYVNMSSPSAGMIRYNGNNQNLEVYDGTSWLTMSMNYAQMDLDADTQSLLEWARDKRNEEMANQALAKSNPTIADLLEQKKKIDEQISIVKTLIKSETTI